MGSRVKAGGRLAGRELWLLALLTLIWGINWPIMKAGVNEIAPMTFRSLTLLIAVPLLWLIIRAQRESLRVDRRYWRELLGIALCNLVIWTICVIYGLRLLSSGRAAILGYTMPIWAALIGIALYGERPGPRLRWGVLAAALGVILLMVSEFSALSGSPFGALLLLVAAASWALGTHLTRRRKLASSATVITFWSAVLALVACMALALLTERDQWNPSAISSIAGFSVFYNSVIVFGVAQVLWFRLAMLLPPVASGLSVLMIPVIGLSSGALALGEPLYWQDAAALLCVVIAIATVLLPARAPEPQAKQNDQA
jgi:drug/metabolite transporter (DMT)-like permease